MACRYRSDAGEPASGSPGLTEAQLDTPYRPGGWTVRQVVHHFADSHMNAYVRFRLALTENEPTIKPYDEGLWAQLSDARTAPAELSLTLLDSLHQRWVLLLRSLKPEDFARAAESSGTGARDAGEIPRDVRLARETSRGPHHQPARALRLEGGQRVNPIVGRARSAFEAGDRRSPLPDLFLHHQQSGQRRRQR